MARKSNDKRDMGAPDLAALFPSIVQGAHVMKGRDSNLISVFKANTGWDAVDIIYAMVRYQDHTPRDIRAFLRWCHRTDPLGVSSYERREVEVAELLSLERMPPSVMVYFDLEGNVNNPIDYKYFRESEQELRIWVDRILGKRLYDDYT